FGEFGVALRAENRHQRVSRQNPQYDEYNYRNADHRQHSEGKPAHDVAVHCSWNRRLQGPETPATEYENEWYNSAILASGRRKPVEASEIAETIHGGHETHSAEGDATFRRYAAIYLGVIAMLLAIASLGGSNATKVMLSANIQASDTYGFYQSRNIRQTIFQTFAEELEAQLLAQPDMPEAAKAKFEAAIKRYNARVERYESDPAT